MPIPTSLKNSKRISDRGFEDDARSVASVIGLDGDIRDNFAFSTVTSRLRNRNIGAVLGLQNSEVEALGELDLSQQIGIELDELVQKGGLPAERRDEIATVAEFAKLLDDDFEAVRALRDEGVEKPVDLAHRDQADWKAFLERHNVEPPEGLDVSGMAALVTLNIEQAFPSAVALDRYARRERSADLDAIGAIASVQLPEDDTTANGLFSADGVNRSIVLNASSDDDAERVRAQLDDVNRLANRYARLGVREILNDRETSADDKRVKITSRQASLRSFLDANPDFDLTVASLSALPDEHLAELRPSFDAITDEDRPYVRAQLTSMQRAMRLGGGSSEMDALMAAGLDNARAIVATTDADDLARRTRLPVETARRIRADAVETNTRLSHFVSLIDERVIHGRYAPAAIGLGDAGRGTERDSDPDRQLFNALAQLPGYADLFGNQNFCKCKHCQSILSPGAYFVDLMRFIDKHITKPFFTNNNRDNHPLNLKTRRPDLWTLPLTCENTDTRIRYLTIVNEVLEQFLEDGLGTSDIYRELTELKRSTRQPFHLPFAELVLYLKHLGVRLSEIYRLYDLTTERSSQPPSGGLQPNFGPAFDTLDPNAEPLDRNRAEQARAILELSPTEFDIIATPDRDAVARRFGSPDDLRKLDVQLLLRKLDLDRTMLDRFLALDFVNQGMVVESEISSIENDLIGLVETLRTKLANDQVAHDDLVLLLLDRLHRIARLHRALDWEPEELQLFISVFAAPAVPEGEDLVTAHTTAGGALNAAALINLADLQRISFWP